jgi:type I restriction enzyme S subunit
LQRKLESIETDLVSLERSILAKAFRGELVAQDPNDEPADTMLARLRGTTETSASIGAKSLRKTKTDGPDRIDPAAE